MAFVIVGVLLLGLKLAGFGPVAAMSWWWAVLPFGLAAAWWTFADQSGLTRRRAMAREDERARQRRERQFESLGMRPPGAPKPPKKD